MKTVSLAPEYKSLLVVDDSLDNCTLIEAYLKSSQVQLSFAQTCKSAFEKLQQSSFDALLLDYELPDENAAELLGKVRKFEALEGRSPIPCFLISGHKSVPESQLFAAHIVKPFTKTQIIEILNDWSQKHPTNFPHMKSGRGDTMEVNVVKVEKDLEDLIPNFVSNRKKDVRSLGEWITSQNYEEIRRLGHTLKGVCASYGFPQLGEMGKELEVHAKTQDVAEISKVHKKMSDFVENHRIEFI